MITIADVFDKAQVAVCALPIDSDCFSSLSDDELLARQGVLAEMRRQIDSCSAVGAGEIARRSRRELGYRRLAQSTGDRTAQALLQRITQSTGAEASALVRVGTLMHEVEATRELLGGLDSPGSSSVEEPWLSPVVEALTSGRLTVAGAAAIQSGLGLPGERLPGELLRDAATRLVEESQGLNADQLFKVACAVRDELDATGIADRENARRERRSFRIVKLPDGMVRVVWILDPEAGAVVVDAFDQMTSPRRGGPRFVTEEEQARSNRILNDERTTEQIAHDGFVQLVRIAGEADTGAVFGVRRPAVRVLVSAEALTARSGAGRIEGHPDAVSIESIERIACDTGTVPIEFDDDGQCMNVGREHRLFTKKQRIALAARDGGCIFGDCDRPVSWTEAHHIDQWHRDHGGTDVADGVLLCRFHHMLLHNNHWEIRRSGAQYWLIPPPDIDPERRAIRLRSKSPALADLRRRAG